MGYCTSSADGPAGGYVAGAYVWEGATLRKSVEETYGICIHPNETYGIRVRLDETYGRGARLSQTYADAVRLIGTYTDAVRPKRDVRHMHTSLLGRML